uniref:F-box domain-containing protein n=1 Tax=Bionectria ochroleuca TaxID=29856 RepID=A0A8H7NB62_BIOOC
MAGAMVKPLPQLLAHFTQESHTHPKRKRKLGKLKIYRNNHNREYGSLDSLPLELQVEIITNLDPIGLISLSQTSRYFRNVIEPKKREFVERLLQLELTEEFGGPAFEYRARYFDELKFLWASEPWQAIRWACCGCMQLLSHVHFDNRSLLRLELRKPSSEPSEKTLTNWRVTLQGKNWSSRDQQSISDEERSRRKRYQIADSYLPSSSFDLSDIHFNLEALREDLGFEGFDDLDEAQFRELSTEDRLEIFDRNIASIESERCGLKRHLRRCNECNTKETRLGVGPMDVAVHPQFPYKSAGRYVARLSYIDFSPTTGLGCAPGDLR